MVTRYENTTMIVNATFVTSFDIASNQLPATVLDHQEVQFAKLEGSRTVTAGVTVQSPQAFYIFSTVKIITALPVTDEAGGVNCATTSTDRLCCWELSQSPTGDPYACPAGNDSTKSFIVSATRTFDGINTHAEDYFDLRPGGTVFMSETSSSVLPITSSPAEPETSYNYSIISFPTPFIYLPSRGATPIGHFGGYGIGLIGAPEPSSGIAQISKRQDLAPTAGDAAPPSHFEGEAEDFGYVPQALIDWMLQSPDIRKQYPGLASCLPGGPRIHGEGFCNGIFSPSYQEIVPALIVSSEITIQSDGCFHPGACPTAQSSSSLVMTKSLQSATPGPMTVDPVQFGPTLEDTPSFETMLAAKSTTNPATVSSTRSDPLSNPQFQSTMPLESTSSRVDSVAPWQQLPTYGTSKTQTSLAVEAKEPNLSPVQPLPNPQPNIASLILNGFGPKSSPMIQDSSPRIIDGQILSPGGQPLVISGTTYSLPTLATAVLVNGYSITSSTSTSNALDSSGNNPVTIGGQVVNLGASAITVSGTTYSLPTTGTNIIVNGSPSPIVDIPKANTARPFVIDGTTLVPGASTVEISGTTYSLPSSGTILFVNGLASPISTPETMSAIIQGPVVINGVTITPGSSATMVAGTAYSQPIDGTAIFINGSPSPSPRTQASMTNAIAAEPFITAGHTITPGAPAIVLSGTTLSLPSSGGSLIINGSPSPLSIPTPSPENSALIIASQTIFPGSAITVSGTVISIPATNTAQVVVNGEIESIMPVNATSGSVGNEAVFTIGEISVTGVWESVSPKPSLATAAAVEGKPSTVSSGGVNGNGTASVGAAFKSSTPKQLEMEWWAMMWMLGQGFVLALAYAL